tara:strand:+ start:845 stop:1222 length:378 start_codon:yes stop_codon:yes gene_type:complete
MIGIGHGVKSAISIEANGTVTGSFLAIQAVITGSATIDSSTTEGPVVALGDADDTPITQLTNVVWGDNRNSSTDGLHHFTSHSIAKINLPVGSVLQGPIYSFGVAEGTAIGYMSERQVSSSAGLY